jgi:hypothetical protein
MNGTASAESFHLMELPQWPLPCSFYSPSILWQVVVSIGRDEAWRQNLLIGS